MINESIDANKVLLDDAFMLVDAFIVDGILNDPIPDKLGEEEIEEGVTIRGNCVVDDGGVIAFNTVALIISGVLVICEVVASWDKTVEFIATIVLVVISKGIGVVGDCVVDVTSKGGVADLLDVGALRVDTGNWVVIVVVVGINNAFVSDISSKGASQLRMTLLN